MQLQSGLSLTLTLLSTLNLASAAISKDCPLYDCGFKCHTTGRNGRGRSADYDPSGDKNWVVAGATPANMQSGTLTRGGSVTGCPLPSSLNKNDFKAGDWHFFDPSNVHIFVTGYVSDTHVYLCSVTSDGYDCWCNAAGY